MQTLHTNFLQWHTPDSESRFDRVALTVSSRLRRLEGEFDGVTEIGLGVTNVNFLKGTNADRPRAARRGGPDSVRCAGAEARRDARAGILVM